MISVLLAYGSEVERGLIASGLAGHGFAVTEVGGTLDALLQLHGGSFEALVASFDLGDGDGVALLTQAGAIAPSLRARLLASATPDADRGRIAGVDVVGRPVRLQELVDTLNRALGVAAPAEDGSVVYTVEYKSFIAQIGKLPDAANALIRLFDGRRTLDDAIVASGVERSVALDLLPTLRAAGVLRGASTTDEAAAVGTGTVALSPAAIDEAALRSKIQAEEQARLDAEARAAEEAARRAADEAARIAEEERRRADKARRRAEEERLRREEEERQRTLAQIQALDAEQQVLEQNRQRELEAGREEAERLMREAQARAASLEAEAKRRADAIAVRERELHTQKIVLAEGLGRHASQAMAAVPPVAPVAVAAHLDRERAAMASDVHAPVHAGAPAPPPAPTYAPAAATMAMAAGAMGAGATHALHVHAPAPPAPDPAAAPAAPPLAPSAGHRVEDDFFKDSQFFARQAATGAHADELFAEPKKEKPSPVLWIVGGVLVLLFIYLFTNQSRPAERPDPPAAPAAPVVEAPPAEPPPVPAAPPEPPPIDLAAARTTATNNAEAIASNVAFTAGDVGEASSPARPVAPAAAARGPATPRATSPAAPPAPAAPANATEAERALTACANMYAAGDYSATIPACEEAVRVNSRNSDAYTYLGNAHYELNNVAQAIRFLEQAVTLNGRNRNALLSLGAARQDAGNRAGAREAYERFLEIAPDSRRAPEVRSILETL